MAEEIPDNLKQIKWSDESLPLSKFVTQYPLPQIVQVEHGYDGGLDENSLSSGQVLKIHKLTVERKLLCYDRNNREVCISALTDQKIILRAQNYDVIFKTVADLAKAKPLPTYVEVTRGYYNVDSNVDYELSVEPGEQLKVVQEAPHKRKKHMLFKNNDNVEIKIPFDCVAGFRPLVDNKKHLLAEILPNETNETTYPFFFEFEPGGIYSGLGVLKCTSVYDEKLIIASCGQEHFHVVFMIPQNFAITVKIALGTLRVDPEYDNIRKSFHDFQEIENRVQCSRMSKIYSRDSEISGFTMLSKNKTSSPIKFDIGDDWEKFENRTNDAAKTQDIALAEPTYQDSYDNAATTGDLVSALNSKENFKTEIEPIKPTINPNDEATCLIQKNFEINQVPTSKNATDVSDMSVKEICANLHLLNMSNYAPLFEKNQVDGALLCELEKDELADLGLTKFEAKKLIAFKKGWRPKTN